MTTDLLVDIQGLNVSFGSGARRTRVVKDLSLRIAAGECVALVGESGSGKSVTARTLVGLTGHDSHVDAERIEFEGRDTRGFSERAWRRIRGAEIGFVLQDALASLDALRTVGAEVAEPLKVHARLTRRERDAEVLRLLQSVGVPEPAVRARQRPHELSGGQRQRALIASAIAASPRLVIADEPTTALDATIAAQIIRLLGDLKADGRGLLLVSHDLSVVAALADRIAVMHHGVIVEEGTADRKHTDAQHPYTQDLLAPARIAAVARAGDRPRAGAPHRPTRTRDERCPRDRSARADEDVPGAGRRPPHRRRRRRPRGPGRSHARHRRRIRIRQDDDRADPARRGARRLRRCALEGHAPIGARPRRELARPPLPAGRLSGSSRVVRPSLYRRTSAR
jgi:peptide/nickel transport system ATP-binding protein